MKISVENSTASIGNIATYTNKAWRVVWDQGALEPGSSGSPLFDPSQRVIGQAYSNTQPVDPPCNQQTGGSNYGRLDLSWDGGGTAATRLKDWLDPNNTGATSTNSSDVSNLYSLSSSAYSINGPSQFCTSGTYSVTGLPTGASVAWHVNSIHGQQGQSVTNNVLTLSRISDGSASVSATIWICGFSVSVSAITVQVGGTLMDLTAQMTNCDEATFTLNNAPSSGSFSWSSAGGNILYNGTSTTATTSVPYITATAVSNDQAIVTTNNSCSQSVSYGFTSTPYERAISGAYPEYVGFGEHLSVSVNTTSDDTYYRWYVNNNLVKEGSSASSYCTCYYESHDYRQCDNNTVRVEVETSCNINTYAEYDFYIYCGYRMMRSNLRVLPNPASSVVQLELDLSGKATATSVKEFKTVTIRNKMGVIVKETKYRAGLKKVEINILDLAPDVYFIEVSDGKNRTSTLLRKN